MTTFVPSPTFLWGVAIGSHQSEGNNHASDWWYRETMADSPVAEPCGDAIDSFHRWPEDLDLAASAGFRDYRFGIEWSRIEPADGRISLAAVQHYRRIVERARELGMRPLVTLHHFTLPLWFAAQGGWTSPDATERFLRYIDAVAPVLDAGVERVMTINEPNIVAVFPKLQSGESLNEGMPEPVPELTDALIAAHREAVTRLHENHPGILAGWGISVQDYQGEPGAADAHTAYCEPRDQVFMRATEGDDWVGVQTYTRARIGADGRPIQPTGLPLTQTGWEDYPAALGGAVRRTASVVGSLPIIVTENGIATGDDSRRIAFVTEALASLQEVIDEGVDVRGYFHWSLLDNWEWGHWSPTFGLVAVDRETFERHPKPSLGWLGGLAAATHPSPDSTAEDQAKTQAQV